MKLPKMTGRKAKYCKDDVLKIIKNNLDQIIVDGKVVGKNSDVWMNIIERENIDITALGLYILVLKNKDSFLPSVVKKLQNDQSIANVSTDTVGEISNLEPESSGGGSDDQDDIKFTIPMNFEKWETIKPINFEEEQKLAALKDKNVRKYLFLRPNVWTDVLKDLIADRKPEIPCVGCLQFKKGLAYSKGEPLLKVYGECSQCKASIYGEMKEIPTANKSFRIHMVVSKSNPSKH